VIMRSAFQLRMTVITGTEGLALRGGPRWFAIPAVAHGSAPFFGTVRSEDVLIDKTRLTTQHCDDLRLQGHAMSKTGAKARVTFPPRTVAFKYS